MKTKISMAIVALFLSFSVMSAQAPAKKDCSDKAKTECCDKAKKAECKDAPAKKDKKVAKK
ncbi:MAG: hypothetical protein GX102_05060 [Porphyromonadaceae bacterium]|jgi:hypothetical protein|nr:hypothetical protein [Porphyromonadaceae bacterium]